MSSKMTYDVFLSYSHQDNDFAELVRLKMLDCSVVLWVDHLGLKAGDDWKQGIDDAIAGSSALVVILSPYSMKSPYVTYEWAYACGLGIPVIPILYEDTDLHPKLRDLYYLDFTHKQHRPWSTLADVLKDRISSRTPAPEDTQFSS